ncbi:WbqC family protein [Halobellus inordinatus]|uniref:WbqC family protein n=1 Tax=Halobellus inordinatus TaxID=1126236 RepID=UPI002109E98A|nr:WbqC family protein [Halobellus inordinatus]
MTRKIVAAHQPNYLPWIGYFHKIHESDVFVVLDDVEYSSGSWINRNKIKTPDGWSWLSVPVGDTSVPINEVEIAGNGDWREEHWKSFQQNYANANEFESLASFLEETYDREWASLDALNVHLLKGICDRVGIEYSFVHSSELDTESTGAERLAELCDQVDADVYLSGMGADGYMQHESFKEIGVAVEYQDFEHPTYRQRFDGFEPYMSFVDAVMNVGPKEAIALLDSL